MTKARDALSFDEAVMKVGLELKWEKAAEAVWLTTKQVRNWSDPEKGGPNIKQALALDIAFVREGHGAAPILVSYMHQLERATGVSVCPVPLGDLTLRLVREFAEGLAAISDAGGLACPREKNVVALKELGDLADAVEALRKQIAARLQPELKAVAS